jgi:BCD family chlorophyll transporter-like MFS transporter
VQLGVILGELKTLTWFAIIRLGLIQTCLGALIFLPTNTLNRIMVVEYALAASVPGFLITLHHVVQLARPYIGYGSDRGGRRTPWIIGGMIILAIGSITAALGTTLVGKLGIIGHVIAAGGYLLIGVGSGAAGTSLLVLLSKQVSDQRKPAAASLVWFMMIMGFAVTGGITGQLLDPFSEGRLMTVICGTAAIALLVTFVAIVGIEQTPDSTEPVTAKAEEKPPFLEAIKEVWSEDHARRFTIFVFASMLAYSAQDLILEPFVGLTFGWTVGQTTALAGIQHSGMLLGMLAMAVSTYAFKRRTRHVLHLWIRGGCIVSAFALILLAFGGMSNTDWPINLNVFVLGVANGSFAVAAIGGMMMLASQGRAQRDGLRMGLWGAAQAISFAMGGFLGTVAVDLTGLWLQNPATSYGIVFIAEAILFLWAASLIFNIDQKIIDSEQNDSEVDEAYTLKNQLGGVNP